MYLLTEWEGRTGKYLARGLMERTRITQHAFLASTARAREFSLSYGLPTKLRAGPYGSYDKSTLARPAGSTLVKARQSEHARALLLALGSGKGPEFFHLNAR